MQPIRNAFLQIDSFAIHFQRAELSVPCEEGRKTTEKKGKQKKKEKEKEMQPIRNAFLQIDSFAIHFQRAELSVPCDLQQCIKGICRV